MGIDHSWPSQTSLKLCDKGADRDDFTFVEKDGFSDSSHTSANAVECGALFLDDIVSLCTYFIFNGVFEDSVTRGTFYIRLYI